MGRHLRAILQLPFVVCIVMPVALLALTGDIRLHAASAAIGLLTATAGLALMVWTISLFARVGEGTLAPWDAPRRLVIVGPYRYMRNPMITGVFLILLGEAVGLGSPTIFVWFTAFVLLNLLYIPLVEEPQLQRRFGESYRRYQRNVPRWIPRTQPWTEENSV